MTLKVITSDGLEIRKKYIMTEPPISRAPPGFRGSWQLFHDFTEEIFWGFEVAAIGNQQNAQQGDHQLSRLHRLYIGNEPGLIFRQASPLGHQHVYAIGLNRNEAEALEGLPRLMIPQLADHISLYHVRVSLPEFKYLYNHIMRARNENPSPWIQSPNGDWAYLDRTLPADTFPRTIARLLENW